MVVAAALGAAVLVVGGGVLAFGGSSPKPAAEPFFATLPAACPGPGEALMSRYLPRTEKPTQDGGWVLSGPEQYVSCTWSEPMSASGAKTVVSRQLHIAVRLYRDASALTKATDEYGAAWRSSSAGTMTDSIGSMHNEAPERLSGIGDEAFVHHRTAKTALRESGTASMSVRLQNAVISLEFQGAEYPLDRDGVTDPGKARPLGKAQVREAVIAFGRNVAASLAACKKCRTP